MTTEEKETLTHSLKREIMDLPSEGCVKVNYGKNEVNKIIPHRAPFNLISTITAINLTNQIIEATNEHPFYVKGGWIRAGNLKAGDKFFLSNKINLPIRKISIIDTVVTVYNITVDEVHDYFIGTLKVLAHNNSCEDLFIKGFGKVNKELFHRVLKPTILRAAGKFLFSVGKNPDIIVINGLIRLIGNGPFKGKVFDTFLEASKFL